MNAMCQRDEVATKLRCAQCDAGICPACLVRTPIGYKCSGCVGGSVVTKRPRRAGVPLIVGVVLVAALASLGLLKVSGDRTSAGMSVPSSPVAEAEPTRQAAIGEEAHDGKLVFVVEDFTCDAKAGDAGAGKLCTLRFNARNASDSPARLLGRFQYLVDAQGRTYGADEALTRAASENAGRSLTELNVNPGVVVGLVFVFDVPDTVEPTEAQFRGTGRSRIGVSVRLERRA